MRFRTYLRGLFSSAFALLLLMGCSNTQSLQEYYVDNSENPNFLILDVPANIVKLDEQQMSSEQRDAISSLRKLNILAFKKTTENEDSYKVESAKVREILKNSDFKELMKLNTPYGKGVVKYIGEGDAIDEVVIYGDSRDNGFALIRVLGDNMNPAHIAQLMQTLQSSDMDGEGLKELAGLFKG